MEMEPVTRLSRDMAQAARALKDAEARFLVDNYYNMQKQRIQTGNQVFAMGEQQEPNSVIQWLAQQNLTLEGQIKRALDQYTQAHPMGEWMRQVKGIGPVLSAALLAYIDIRKAPTAGHIWSYAGLDPSKTWGKGEKRPWNGTLKTVCWKIGQSFMKFSNDPACFYGQIYRERKAYEISRNETGGNMAEAAARMSTVGKGTEAYAHYAAGHLPPSQIDGRARRYAVKLFLSHLQDAWWRQVFKTAPPAPFAIAILGHAHMIDAPVSTPRLKGPKAKSKPERRSEP